MSRSIARYKALMPAIQHVSMLVAEHMSKQPENASVVFDIDDTLIFDDNHQTPNVQVKHLLEVARAHGCKVHLVTAREKSAEVTKWTRDELRRHGIQYDSLALAPKKVRDSMASIAKWKHSERAKHAPVILSVGDQWGDCVLLNSEDDIDTLDAVHVVSENPWVIISPNDGITVFALKLMA